MLLCNKRVPSTSEVTCLLIAFVLTSQTSVHYCATYVQHATLPDRRRPLLATGISVLASSCHGQTTYTTTLCLTFMNLNSFVPEVHSSLMESRLTDKEITYTLDTPPCQTRGTSLAETVFKNGSG